MRGKRCASSESDDDSNEGGERYAADHSGKKPELGDVIWGKLHDGKWWPGVVVEESSVSGSNKPSSRSTGDVLVRRYGSYEYAYVNPVECRSSFEIALKQNDDCYLEILRKALEEDLPYLKSSRLTGQGSKTKGSSNGRANASKGKKSNENQVNLQERVSNRKERNKVTPQKTPKDNDLLPKDADGIMDGVIRRLDLDSPDLAVGNSKRKMPKKDGMQKEQKQTGSRAKEASHRTSNRSQKRRKQNGYSDPAEECESPERDEELNTAEPNTPRSGTFFGKLQELRARRTEVMKKLGLAAPSGPPFL